MSLCPHIHIYLFAYRWFTVIITSIIPKHQDNMVSYFYVLFDNNADIACIKKEKVSSLSIGFLVFSLGVWILIKQI